MAGTEIFRFMFVKPPGLKSGKELRSKTITYTLHKSPLFQTLEHYKNNGEVDNIISGSKDAFEQRRVFRNIADIQDAFIEKESLLGWMMPDLDTITADDIIGWLQNKNISPNQLQMLWDTLIVHSVLGNPEGITDLVVGLIRLETLLEAIGRNEVKENADVRLVMESMVVLPIEIFPINSPKEIVDIPDAEIVIDNTISQKEILEKIKHLKEAKIQLQKIFSIKLKEVKNKLPTFDEFKEEYNNLYEEAVPILGSEGIRANQEITDGSLIIGDEELEKRYNESIQQSNAFKLSIDDFQALKIESQAIMKEFQIVSENQEIPDLINEIDKSTLDLSLRLEGKEGFTVTYLDQGIAYDFSSKGKGLCLKENSGLSYCDLLRKLYREDPAKPIVNILGIGEYKVIRQELLKYEAGEIADIKNVFAGEVFKRSIRNLKRTEEFFETETERETKQDNEVSSTDRFEMSKEISEQIDKSSKLEFGLSSSASYGQVSVSANASYTGASNSSKASKSASNFAKETTEKASNSIRKKVREKRSKLSVSEIEIINSYELSNDTPDHKVGIYRWVDKYYSNQLYNIGKRLMLEFYIPSPMAFYIHSRKSVGKKGITTSNPIHPRVHNINGTFLLNHKNLDRNNYHLWVNAYNVTDFSLPPVEFINLQYGIKMTGAHGTPTSWQEKIENIPSGYAAFEGIFFANTPAWIKSIPDSYYYDSQYGRRHILLPEIENEFTLSGLNNGPGYAYLGLKCKLTDNGYEQWKIDTYTAIMESYEGMKADYENQLAAAQIQGGVQIEGNNPAMNTAIIKEELEKWCTEALLLDRFHTWNAMQKATTGEPEIDFNILKKEMPIVSFMNTAFEWENMTYKFLPYFYGNKAEHTTIREISDVDPKFMAALRAGYARVIIPVSFEFNAAVLHFIKTGQVWNGGNLPVLGDPLFQSIVDDIYGEEYNDKGTAEGGPWETKLPTTLIWLQNNPADSQLPAK